MIGRAWGPHPSMKPKRNSGRGDNKSYWKCEHCGHPRRQHSASTGACSANAQGGFLCQCAGAYSAEFANDSSVPAREVPPA